MARPAFNLFRYQIIPVNRELQLSFAEGPKSIDELLSEKNARFLRALVEIGSFGTPRTDVTHAQLAADADSVLMRFGVNRSLDRETRDFRHESVETWPSFLVFFWNSPDKQIVGIEHRFEAFQYSETALRLIFNKINERLHRQNLRVLYEPIVERRVFWDLAARYEGKIQSVEFEIITPNMANISAALDQNLKDLAKHTNTAKTHVALEANPGTALSIKGDDKMLDGLVNYSASGGGDVKIRVVGLRKTIHTSRSVKTVEIDEFEASDPKVAVQMLKALLE